LGFGLGARLRLGLRARLGFGLCASLSFGTHASFGLRARLGVDLDLRLTPELSAELSRSGSSPGRAGRTTRRTRSLAVHAHSARDAGHGRQRLGTRFDRAGKKQERETRSNSETNGSHLKA